MNVIDGGATIFWSDEDGCWLARSTEYGLLGDGDTPQEARECLDGAVRLHLEIEAQERGEYDDSKNH